MKQLGSDALHPLGAGTDRAVSDRPAVSATAPGRRLWSRARSEAKAPSDLSACVVTSVRACAPWQDLERCSRDLAASGDKAVRQFQPVRPGDC